MPIHALEALRKDRELEARSRQSTALQAVSEGRRSKVRATSYEAFGSPWVWALIALAVIVATFGPDTFTGFW